MSVRELVVLGTASQVPTRHRNHNGYLLRWDGEGILFDPGEGTQRQMLRAGVAAHDINRICITHFHGDHSLGLAGVIQRINLDQVPHPVTAHYPASGRHFFERLRYATAYRESVQLTEAPVAADGILAETNAYTLYGHRLSHPVESYGYRLVEPDRRRMLPERLAEHGISGPDVGRIQREGSLGGVGLDEVSESRRGQRFAFIMDTRLCDGVYALAEGATCWSSSRPSSTRTNDSPPTTVISPPDRRPGWPGRREHGISCSRTSHSGTRTRSSSPPRPVPPGSRAN